MNPLGHLVTTGLLSRRPRDLIIGLLPDVANPSFIFMARRLPESDPRIRVCRILHSPITVVAVVLATGGRGWPYLLHWLADLTCHQPYQVWWPFVKERNA